MSELHTVRVQGLEIAALGGQLGATARAADCPEVREALRDIADHMRHVASEIEGALAETAETPRVTFEEAIEIILAHRRPVPPGMSRPHYDDAVEIILGGDDTYRK